jgi:hypothetical protein
VLGLVIVVPRLACRPCPRLNGIADGEAEGEGVPVAEPRLLVGGTAVSSVSGAPSPTLSAPAPAPRSSAAGEVAGSLSVGVAGMGEDAPDEGLEVELEPEDMSALPSSEVASTSSGGRRSFSMSDLRL